MSDIPVQTSAGQLETRGTPEPENRAAVDHSRTVDGIGTPKRAADDGATDPSVSPEEKGKAEAGLPKQPALKKTKTGIAREKIEDTLTCAICLSGLHQAVSCQPCLHSFCRGCLTGWIKSGHSAKCPQCRGTITMAGWNHNLNALLEAYLTLNPSNARSEEEIKDLETANMFGPGDKPMRLADTSHQDEFLSASEDSYEDDEDEDDDDGLPPLHACPCPLRSAAGPLRGFQFHNIPPGSFSENRFEQTLLRNYLTEKRLSVNSVWLSGLDDIQHGRYILETILGQHKVRRAVVNTNGGDANAAQVTDGQANAGPQPTGNAHEATNGEGAAGSQLGVDADAATDREPSAGLQPVANADEATDGEASAEPLPDIEDAEHNAPEPGAAAQPNAQQAPSNPNILPELCIFCCTSIFEELCYLYREDLCLNDPSNSFLPAEARNRPNCWYGRECRTQRHNESHARRLNHVCAPTPNPNARNRAVPLLGSV
ncbi:uncharacterized protein EV422DRAFT_530024 [Fimicolochytrium jonesii]|uniref:uncharacterized protein n=1 Tax=Fimicolochytrium jonesii TaxID=1396493 RepID=UPI0022FE8F3A|nr:uncharacterized protein EV422DRAFT_530024 [Fimicolochytrium jonesii]KAI8820755.1 hypothetical protein EV422DRAFT_530024 [Fimicolochytrium jonesii]